MPPKFKVVFDTNIYLSAIIFGGPPRACLDLARKKKITLYASREIFYEVAKVLREKFGWLERDIEAVVIGLSKFSFILAPKFKVDLIKKDPMDNRILEVAKEGEVDFVISGDKKHILSLGKFEGIKIVSAAKFLKML